MSTKLFSTIILVEIIFLSLLFTFISCSDNSLEMKNVELQTQINELKAELEDCRYGPQRLLEEARLFYKDSLYEKAKNKVEYIVNNHFGSPQTNDAKELLSEISIAIEKQKEEQRLAEEKAKKEKEKEIALATKNMHIKLNEYTEITWYQDKSSPRYVNRNGFFLQFGKYKSGSLTSLRLNIQYHAEDWLFIKTYNFVVDGKTYSIFPDDVETDSGYGGKIWEWYEVPLNLNTYNLIKDIVNSKVAKIRFNGSQYYDERTISSKQKKALKNVLTVYEVLGGKLEF